ncbi:hypothetical protein WJX72_002790 [[Myrmecia] bisecta]|uniref:3-oxo-5-alpha-steroid 4-dehydrogenase C-terminal domain-containing protein n=1 Tax=[Myrmecia] bisecta TaxID=41462 RepID=A0AAW1R666_9CHLO
MQLLGRLLVVPDWTFINLAIALFGVLNIVLAGPREARRGGQIGYSKFCRASKLLLAFHFLKRELEVLFLHQYSSRAELEAVSTAGIGYTLLTVQVPDHAYEQLPLLVGLAMFVTGELGNFYHHYLLASLRSTGQHGYVLPTRGLFDRVSCPHYLFEIIAWVGIATVSQHLLNLLSAFGMGSYLLGRAAATTHWYRQKFDDYPKDRKHVLPYVF